MSMQNKNIAMMVIIMLVVGAGAFYGGTAYEKSSLTSQGLLRSASAQMGGRAGGQGGPNQGRPGGAMGANSAGRGGDFVSGQVTAKDDTSVTIKSPDGSSKIVFFSPSTTVGKATQGTIADVNVGDQVMANGKTGTDGSLSAQSIQIRPSTN